MSPAAWIAQLDGELAKKGEDIILRRVVGVTPNQQNVDVLCRAKVDAVSIEQIIGGIDQTLINVIISPTQINAAGWPGGTVPALAPLNPDPRIPKINDKVVARGITRNIMVVDAKVHNGVLVRINLRVG